MSRVPDTQRPPDLEAILARARRIMAPDPWHVRLGRVLYGGRVRTVMWWMIGLWLGACLGWIMRNLL